MQKRLGDLIFAENSESKKWKLPSKLSCNDKLAQLVPIQLIEKLTGRVTVFVVRPRHGFLVVCYNYAQQFSHDGTGKHPINPGY